jgi:hypothetical protein
MYAKYLAEEIYNLEYVAEKEREEHAFYLI